MAKVKTPRPLAKSPIWPAIMSALVLPGVGQILNRELLKGLFLGGAFLVPSIWFSKVITERLSLLLPGTPEQWAANPDIMLEALKKLVDQNTDMFLTFQLLIMIVWIYSVVDAYLVAKRRLKELPREDSNPIN